MNWREHPPAQREALRGLLEEVGFAGVILARKTRQGLEVIDGHLRVEDLGEGARAAAARAVEEPPARPPAPKEAQPACPGRRQREIKAAEDALDRAGI
jgi:hypothetical protein